MADSDEEWARTLCRSGSSATLDDASDDEWARTLCRSSQSCRLEMPSGSAEPGSFSRVSEPAPVLPVSAKSSFGVLLPVSAKSSDGVPLLFDWRDRKRRKLPELTPPTVIESVSLVHQHVQTMMLVSTCSRITCSLMRSWLRCSAKDLGAVSLEGLANSLVARVRGLCCDTTPPSVFKIGLTRDPRWRFHDAPFAYAIDDEYDSMEVDRSGWLSLEGAPEEPSYNSGLESCRPAS